MSDNNEYQFLKLKHAKNGVAVVSLNRPEVHNAFDDALIEELTRVFAELDEDDSVRLAVLRGEGKSFCAGGDVNWMRKMKDYSYEENIADSEKLEKMFSTIANFSKPLIGSVHGNALGGGSGLAAVCDYVIAADNTMFGFTEVRLGIAPCVISPYVIDKIGLSHARAWFLSGMRFNAMQAWAMTLVHNVVPADDLMHQTDEVVKEFLNAGPVAAAKSKELVLGIASRQRDDDAGKSIRKFTIEMIARLRVSEEGQEGMDALLSKRKAKWSA